MTNFDGTKGKKRRDLWGWLFLSLLIYISVTLITPILLKPYFVKLPFIFIGITAVTLSLLAPIIYFSITYSPVTISDLVPRGRDITVLIIAIFAIFILMAIAVISGGWANETMAKLLKLGKKQAIVGYFFIILVGPILEEIYWRKYVLELLRDSYPTFAAILISVSLETIFHFGFLSRGLKPFFFIFLALLFYTIVYLKSRLGVSIIAHSLMNFFILTLSINE